MLVKTLTSFVCATSEQLGFDPRITLLSDLSWLYEFPADSSVGDEDDDDSQPSGKSTFFKTTASVSETRSFHIAGSTTRVWKAIEVVSKEDIRAKEGAKEVIIKDAWMESGARSELEIQRALFLDIAAFEKRSGGWRNHPFFIGNDFDETAMARIATLLDQQRYKTQFLRISLEHRGKDSIAVHKEAWWSEHLFPVDVEESCGPSSTSHRRSAVGVTTKRSAGEPNSDAFGDTRVDRPKQRAFATKQRLITLTRQVCTQIDRLETVGDVMSVLQDAYYGASGRFDFPTCLTSFVTAFLLMFCAGWVHRDISSGNILAFRDFDGHAWRVQVADLEYARKFAQQGHGSDPKTVVRRIDVCYLAALESHSLSGHPCIHGS